MRPGTLVGLGLLAASGGASADTFEGLPDPLAAGWDGAPVCELLREDAAERVLQCTFPPGVGHERHYHPPHFGYVPKGGRMRITDADGVREVDIPTGYEWANETGLDWHEALNVGDTTAVFLIVEPRPPLVELTAEEDHARLLDKLGIEQLRRGADGDPDSAFAANVDESRANELLASLPGVLVGDDGGVAGSEDDWWLQRRPEIAGHLADEIYGRIPAVVPPVRWTAAEPRREDLSGTAVFVQSVTGQVDNGHYPAIDVRIPLEITWPVDAGSAVPVVLELSFGEEFLTRLRERFTPEQLREFTGGGPGGREQVIARGWAWASLDATQVQADNGAGLTRGIIGLVNRGQPREPGDWGALRAWAWGASRARDYFDSAEAFAGERVAVFGHSRFGKAALVAMATDTSIAAAYVSSSGEGGAKLWRRNFGEQIGNIAGAGEYHWVAGNFLRYAGPLDAGDLSVDANSLIALCAPRPVFIGSGMDGDQWTDPKGMFLATAAASPAYELLGAGKFEAERFPPPGELAGNASLAFRQHELGHTPRPNWPWFLDFVAPYFADDGAN